VGTVEKLTTLQIAKLRTSIWKGIKYQKYKLSCFPNIWADTVVLAKDIQAMWNELLSEGI